VDSAHYSAKEGQGELRGKREATGVKPLLLGKTTICIGASTGQPSRTYITKGSDYAGLPSSLLCPSQIFSRADGKSKRRK
jgi:hypothetical protein